MGGTTLKFKIGDKVKLKDPQQFAFGGKILTIVAGDCGDKYIPVVFEGMRVSEYFPVKPCEIKKVNVIGEQLLFSFMEGD